MFKDLFYTVHKQTTKFDIEVTPLKNALAIEWNDQNGYHGVCFNYNDDTEQWENWDDEFNKEDVLEALVLWLSGVKDNVSKE